MQIQVVRANVHRAIVSQAELNYIGSITIDEDLLDAKGIVEGEREQISNINNGERLETYTIKGESDSGTICMKGPIARRTSVGDKNIAIAYGSMELEEATSFTPTLVFPNEESNLIARSQIR